MGKLKEEPKIKKIPSKFNSQALGKTKISAGIFKSPVPPAEEMEHYKKIDPSFPNRIMQMAENEQELTMKVIAQSQKTFGQGQILGFILGFLAIALAFYVVYKEHPLYAASIFVSALGILVISFTFRKIKRK
jgi:uncharacterized membrane protein